MPERRPEASQTLDEEEEEVDKLLNNLALKQINMSASIVAKAV